MFKFNIPLSIVLFSGSLTLLAIGSLLLVSNTAYSSHVQVDENSPINQQLPDIIQSAITKNSNDNPTSELVDSIIPPPSTSESLAGEINNADQVPPLPVRSSNEDSRRRSGRLYGGGSTQSNYANQQANSLDSYAAAYAAVNSPNSQDQSTNGLVSQSNVQANDASTFSSFGESPPGVGGTVSGVAGNGSPSSTASIRQLQSAADYSPHSSYYGGYMSPSYNSASYNGQQDLNSILGGAVSSNNGNNNNNNYHHSTPAQSHYGSNSGHHYHKTASAASPPLGYPTNYDVAARYSPIPANYYDRHNPYMTAASATPHWGSGISDHSSSGKGFVSTASNALSHWTGGFGLSEIVCSIIAIAIGAVILGAPFFLIYLALMGNFSGSGTLSLTNPTSGSLVSPAGSASTTVNGRRKRLAIFEQLSSSLNEHHRRHPNEFGSLADSVVNQLSPFVDLQQLTNTFKRLVDSMEKYSNLRPEKSKKKTEKTSA